MVESAEVIEAQAAPPMPASTPATEASPPVAAGATRGPSTSARARLAHAAAVLYALATWAVLAYAAWIAVHAWRDSFELPLLDRHSFRQTQTAISAWYIAHGGPWFAYETPVFGAPYSMPFEFPLYQWIVVLVHGMHVPLDQAGRAVSIAFFALTTIPFYRLLRRCDVPAGSARLGVAVLLTAPLYLYWTRAFLLESTALFFSVAALEVGVALVEDRKRDARLVWLFVAAALAMLVKVTTAFAYTGAFACILAVRFLADPHRRNNLRNTLSVCAAGFVGPGVLLVLWTRFADGLKEQNLLTRNFITSTALREWNFGTWEQKIAPVTWQVFWDRTVDETFGSPFGLLVGLTLAIFGARRGSPVLGFLVGTLATFAVFTNLHAVHDYYQYSTSALVIAVVALGFGAAEIWTGRAKLLLPFVAMAIILKSVTTYENGYANAQHLNPQQWLVTADFIHDHTSRNAMIVVFGDDWSPLLPYYSRRRALMNRWNHPANHPDIRHTLERSARLGHRVEAVVFCGSDRLFSGLRSSPYLRNEPRCDGRGECVVCY